MSLITLGMGAATGGGGGNPPPMATGIVHAAYPPMPYEVEYLKVQVPPAPRGVTYG